MATSTRIATLPAGSDKKAAIASSPQPTAKAGDAKVPSVARTLPDGQANCRLA